MPFKKPLIGITLSAEAGSGKFRRPTRYAFDFSKRAYSNSIIDAGGIPILLPNLPTAAIINQYLDSVDGLMVTGGDDMHPKYFGQKPHSSIKLTVPDRDEFEIKIIRRALTRDIPILGICRGLQVINIATGGTIYQDLSCAPFETLRHSDPKEVGNVFHKVGIEKRTLLYKVIGKGRIEVKSSHHQIIEKIAKRLRATAFSPDGVVEGLESSEFRFLLAVQWHPENTPKRFHSKRLFRAFVRACRRK
jgi:putative glutamine amidotransferase